MSRAELFREAAWIDGVWTTDGAPLAVYNPATEAVLGHVPDVGAAGVGRALVAAERAFGDWRVLDAASRGRILRRWYELILENADDLARLMVLEQGKPLNEAAGEVRYAAAFVVWFAEEARRVYGEIIPGHAADKRLAVLRQPVGVVAAITPWNFPLAMIARKAAPALAAGCTMVLKPSGKTPFSALALAFLAHEAGVPPGVFQVVTGASGPIGDALTTDRRVRKFTFTGSTATGAKLAAACMGTVKRVSLELGGNAPFLVFDDADLDAAVAGAVTSKFRNSGQTCVCANRFLVQSGIYDAFASALAEKADALQPGNGLEDGVTQGPLIDSNGLQKVRAHVSDAVARGARVLTGGNVLPRPGNFYQPTVLADVSRDALLCREETFGPVAGLVRFDTEEEAVALANDTEAGLAAYMYTRDNGRVHRVSEALAVGMVGVNTGMVSTEVAPFGGVRQSGLGREGSRHGIDEFVEMKLVCTHVPPA